jgi:hypothetical protein
LRAWLRRSGCGGARGAKESAAAGGGIVARLRQLTAKARRRGVAEEGNRCGGVARLL